MSAVFLKNGNTFRPTDELNMDIHDKLPAGNYTIQQDMMGNLYLEMVDSFNLSGKRYGDNDKNAERILATFKSRPSTTGIMLEGEKGSGKSLLAKTISFMAAKEEIPTIIINQPWAGDKFNMLIQSIEQPCIILFDEFEKVYNSEAQEQILTLLDGVFPSKKMFVLTCNDKWRIDSHMRNRPGRIFYMLSFTGLAQDFIEEYCNDNLNNKQYIDSVCRVASMFDKFNMDSLRALVEEMNRYDETPQDALRMLNVKPEFGDRSDFTVELVRDGLPVPLAPNYAKWRGNPLSNTVCVEYDPDPNDMESEYQYVYFSPNDMKSMDAKAGKFVFTNENSDTVVLTKVIEKGYTYFNAL